MLILDYPSYKAFLRDACRADSDPMMAVSRVLPLEVLALSRSPKLFGYVLTRETALSSFGWDFTVPDGANNEIAAQAKARCRDLIHTMITNHAQTALFGCSLYEIEFKFDAASSTKIPRFRKLFHPTEIVQISQNSVGIYDQSLRTINPAPNPTFGDSVVWIADCPPFYFRGGALRLALSYEIMRDDMIREWGSLNRLLKGILQGIDKGADEAEINAAMETLQNAAKGKWIMASDMVDFKHVQTADAAAGASFEKFLMYLDRAISIAILGQGNTAELLQSGTLKAAVMASKQISHDVMFTDMVRAESLINRFLEFDYAQNYGVDAVMPYKFQFNAFEDNDPEGNIIVIREAISAGLNLVTTEAYKMIGMTVPPGTPDVISLKQNAGLSLNKMM